VLYQSIIELNKIDLIVLFKIESVCKFFLYLMVIINIRINIYRMWFVVCKQKFCVVYKGLWYHNHFIFFHISVNTNKILKIKYKNLILRFVNIICINYKRSIF